MANAALRAGIATVVGGALALGGGALSASADPTTEPRCTEAVYHAGNDDPLPDWYTWCVPVYGAGHVQFTLTVPEGVLPADFDVIAMERDDDADAAHIEVYWPEVITGEGSWVNPYELHESSTPTSLEVRGAVLAPVAYVDAVADADLPEGVRASCHMSHWLDAEWARYRAVFTPVETTFRLVGSDGVTYEAAVTVAPRTLYALVGDHAICLSDGVVAALYHSDTDQAAPDSITGTTLMLVMQMLPITPSFAEMDPWIRAYLADPDRAPFDEFERTVPSTHLGTFAFVDPTASPGDADPPAEVLAATGAHGAESAGIAALLLGAVGVALLARRSRAKAAIDAP